MTTSSLVPDDLSGSRFCDFERRFELCVLLVVLPSLLGFRSLDLVLLDLFSVFSEVSFDVLVLLRGFSLPVLSAESFVLVLLRGFSA